jgi:hypothetical protein
MNKAVCSVCRSTIAAFDTLTAPITPDQFQSPDPDRGIPTPFNSMLEWHQFKCPHCRRRPWPSPDEIMVLNGAVIEPLRIPWPAEENKCEICGKTYQHKQSLIRHMKDAHGN